MNLAAFDERSGNKTGQLVMDVGMYDGSDTAYYLSRGHRVVGVEANPHLAAACRQRFAKEIAAAQLTVLNIGVAPTRGEWPFWISRRDPGSSSFDRTRACGNEPDPQSVSVPC